LGWHIVTKHKPTKTQEDYLDAAMKLPVGEGVTLYFESEDDAHSYRFRLYATINRAREIMRTTLPSGDTQWGKSPWEPLVISRKGNQLIIKRTLRAGGPRMMKVGKV
jgi:hypothetical protein